MQIYWWHWSPQPVMKWKVTALLSITFVSYKMSSLDGVFVTRVRYSLPYPSVLCNFFLPGSGQYCWVWFHCWMNQTHSPRPMLMPLSCSASGEIQKAKKTTMKRLSSEWCWGRDWIYICSSRILRIHIQHRRQWYKLRHKSLSGTHHASNWMIVFSCRISLPCQVARLVFTKGISTSTMTSKHSIPTDQSSLAMQA